MRDILKRDCKSLIYENICTTAYHPESNGALERKRNVLTNYLRCVVIQY
jgi:hypothetical protein